jgi:epoxyqueuosine reductase
MEEQTRPHGGLLPEFSHLLNKLFVDGWGIGDISGCPWSIASGYQQAVSLLFAYDYGINEYDEREYHELLLKKERAAGIAVDELCGMLDRQGVRHLPVPHLQDQASLKDVFSHKYAATRAGLGWIGRNSLLITPEWGPRVFLRTVLMDTRLDAAEPVDASRCGECRTCVDACPHTCITGKEWVPGMDRDELIDVFTCNQVRLDATAELGHKDACGFCLLACPMGTVRT